MDSPSESEKILTGITRVDVAVIGGGINGVGIARDAAGRGLDVALCEMGDLGQYTSSSSTKLIHGGLRYLEHYDFKLVRHALQEREVLLRSAPHIIWPLRFILPHHRELRPRWLIRLGLLIYDHLGGRKRLPASRSVRLSAHPAGEALKKTYIFGFEYSDCWVQDARLVVLNAKDAENKGAKILTRTKCVSLKGDSDGWEIRVEDAITGRCHRFNARVVVNAAGPWVGEILKLTAKEAGRTAAARLVKGSHIIVNKLFDHDYPYIFQNHDGRILFAIPYEKDYTLLGTTDYEISGDPAQISITDEEISYICRSVSEYFERPITPQDVVETYSGVRSLFDDQSDNTSQVTRDYVLEMARKPAPLLSVFGGKITTYRVLAEQAVDLLSDVIDIRLPAWTQDKVLPGGNIENADFDRFLDQQIKLYSWLSTDVVADYARNYGTDIATLLNGKGSESDLGEYFGGGLYEVEIRYLIEHEFAQTAEDVLWRRSKKRLRLSSKRQQRVNDWIKCYWGQT